MLGAHRQQRLCPSDEVNSDARSGQIVDDRIKPTLEAGSTVGSSKPVLLVIDEVDGATGSGENVRPELTVSSSTLFKRSGPTLVKHFHPQACPAHPGEGEEET